MAVLTRRRPRQSAESPPTLRKPTESVDPATILTTAQANGIATQPLDLEALVRSYGISLKRRALEQDISGHLKRTNDHWQITLNSLHHPNRQRFTLAHELAHFLLHPDQSTQFVDEKLFRDNSFNRIEREANQFAGALLMPEDEFRRVVRETNGAVSAIADYFAVSPLAVRMRARELGFTGHGL